MRVDELARAIGAELRGDGAASVQRVATLADAGEGDVSFLSNRRYRDQLEACAATAVIVEPRFASQFRGTSLVLDNPYLGYARAAAMLNPEPGWAPGVHASAAVDAGAEVAASAYVGAQCSIEAGARVGGGVYIGPGCVVGRNASVGEGSRLVARVVVCHGVTLGARVLLHPGVVVGADGFGIANDGGRWVKVPQLGGVKIGDDVEIGANTTVDRGALGDTVLAEGVKLDNQIQVGHNVHIGAHTAIAGCVAIAGSTRIGKHCAIGGMSAIAGHLEICDGVQITGMSGIADSISSPGVYSSGMPAQPNRLWRRNIASFARLAELVRRVRALERATPGRAATHPADTDDEGA